MPRGERCPECGSRRWYLHDGLLFCSRGHQIEGFIQFDNGEEEGLFRVGAVSRREKEVRDSEKRQLAGPEAKMLYLEAIQLLLRNQVLWLTKEKGLREELETVVRDLWDLRIRGSPDSDSAAHGELDMFSSQTSPANHQTTWKSKSRAQSWGPGRGAQWPMPRLPETLALCYLAALLLRTPLRQGQILSWVNSGDMPYKQAFDSLPREMQDRMSTAYVRALRLPRRSSLGGEELNRTVTDLVISYHSNYGLLFPEISHMAMLVDYAKLLSLPVECVVVAKATAAVLKPRFQFQVNKTRLAPLDHPEIRLVALLVVATKLCFPLGDKQSPLRSLGGPRLPRFDWEVWKQGLSSPPGNGTSTRDEANFAAMTPAQVAQMSDHDFEAYSAQILSSVDKKNENAITRFFSVQGIPEPALPAPKTSTEQAHESARRFFSQTLHPPSQHERDSMDTRYETFRTVEDLGDTERAFYEAVGDAAGIPLEMLLGAVYVQEQAIVSWQNGKMETDSDSTK